MALLHARTRLIMAALVSGAVAAVAVPVLATASYQPLKTLRAREAEERELAAEVAFTGQVCGTSIRASIDWSTAENWPESVSIARVCDGALGALEAICRSDQSRGSKIKRFQCDGDGSGPDVSGSTLRYGATPGDNAFSETKSYLERAL